MCLWDMFDMDGNGELDDVEKSFAAAAFLGYMEEERRRKEAEEKKKAESDSFDFPSPDDIVAELYGYDAAAASDDDDSTDSQW